MHLRASVQLASIALWGGYVQPRITAGVTELQLGDDTGGLDFFGTGPLRNETAGPEFGASLRILTPVWGGIDLIGQLDATISYLPHAPEMIQPQSAVLPTLTATVGFGF